MSQIFYDVARRCFKDKQLNTYTQDLSKPSGFKKGGVTCQRENCLRAGDNFTVGQAAILLGQLGANTLVTSLIWKLLRNLYGKGKKHKDVFLPVSDGLNGFTIWLSPCKRQVYVPSKNQSDMVILHPWIYSQMKSTKLCDSLKDKEYRFSPNHITVADWMLILPHIYQSDTHKQFFLTDNLIKIIEKVILAYKRAGDKEQFLNAMSIQNLPTPNDITPANPIKLDSKDVDLSNFNVPSKCGDPQANGCVVGAGLNIKWAPSSNP